jgi:ABC-type protease/lipase transport system fused ATPase/permease subunit
LLSGGQRQRVAMARAVFGKSKVVVLDEPNANLDAMGEADLRRAVDQLRKLKRTVVIVTHRPGILPVVDKLAIMKAGQITSFGPRDEVLAALAKVSSANGAPPAQSNVTNIEARHAAV